MFRVHLKYLSIFCVVIAALTSCASSMPVPEKEMAASKKAPAAKTQITPYTGEKTVVGVLPFGLSDKVAALYPKLRDRAVGLGVHNMVEATLTETNRFRFVETNPQVIKDILDRQWSSNAGFTSGAAIEYGNLLGATKVIYGEVFDYSEGGEQVSGLSSKKNFITRVGVEVICTDVGTGERIAVGTGTALGADYGTAAEEAIRQAVTKMVSHL